MQALAEAGAPERWSDYESRILDYFQVSTGQSWTKKNALEVSWCTYFVHWVLVRAGLQPLPKIGVPAQLGDMGSVGRFLKNRGGVYDAYPVGQRKYRPSPGDMYYRPSPNNHVGLISDVREVASNRFEVRTIDGNSGPLSFSPYFDMSEGRKIGYGFVYQPNGWRRLEDECWYIQLCPEQ